MYHWETLLRRFRTNKNEIFKCYCACAMHRRKVYVRHPEVLTSFLLPDCHHGECAMRVTHFLSRISFLISHCTLTTRVVQTHNTPIGTFVKCLIWLHMIILSFIALRVTCRLLPVHNVVNLPERPETCSRKAQHHSRTALFNSKWVINTCLK